MRLASLFAAALLLALGAVSARAQVRVTPDSHLEDFRGDSISCERFVELAAWTASPWPA